MVAEERGREPDPLDGKPLVIEQDGSPSVDPATGKKRRRSPRQILQVARPRFNITVDIASWGIVLAALGFAFLVAAVLTVPALPGPVRPYTLPIRLVLLAVAVGGTGVVLLGVAARLRPPPTPPTA